MIEISSRGTRDLRRMGPGANRDQVIAGLRALGEGGLSLDVTALAGHSPWVRLRVGNFRILYRPIEGGYLVDRIVDRRDLERAVRSLRS